MRNYDGQQNNHRISQIPGSHKWRLYPLEKHEKTLSCFLYGKTEKPRNTALTLCLALLMQQRIMVAEVKKSVKLLEV